MPNTCGRASCELGEWQLNDAAAQAQQQVPGGLFLDVVVGRDAAILQLLTSGYQSQQCVRILSLSWILATGVPGLYLKSDGLSIRVFTKICVLVFAWLPRGRERELYYFLKISYFICMYTCVCMHTGVWMLAEARKGNPILPCK